MYQNVIYEHIEQKIAKSIMKKPKKLDMVEVVLRNKELFKHFNSEEIEKIQIKYMKQFARSHNKKAKSTNKIKPVKIVKEVRKVPVKTAPIDTSTIYGFIESKIQEAFLISENHFETSYALEEQYKHFDQSKISRLLSKYYS